MIYIIVRLDFDSLENHYGNALNYKILGYIDGDKEKAQKIVEELNKTQKYNTWDGEYPKFSFIEVKNYEQG